MDSNLYIRYVILLSTVPGTTLSENLVRDHVQHLKRLDAAGQLELCGPFLDGRGGMLIVRADSPEHAEELALADPFVREGVRTFELRAWELSCEANNHLGMGCDSTTKTSKLHTTS